MDTLIRLRSALVAFVLLTAFAALPAEAQRIHELSYNNAVWADRAIGGAQIGGSYAPMVAFQTTPNNQRHVYYVPLDGDMHQLFFNGSSWADEDLTKESSLPYPLPPTPRPIGTGLISGFSVGNFQYVFYAGADYHVHQLLYNNARWVDTDLTRLSGTQTTLPGSDGQQAVIAMTTNPAVHVFYVGSDQHIHQLFSDNDTTWQDQDLTAITIHTGPSRLSLHSGFSNGNLQYVYWMDWDIVHLHQLYYNNSNWSDTNLTNLTGLETSVTQGIASALALPGTQQIRLYTSAVRYVQGYPETGLFELASSNNGTWRVTNLTGNICPNANAYSTPLAYVTTPNNGVHVFYFPDSDVFQLYQPTLVTWKCQDLTSQTGGDGVAQIFQHLAGFSNQNLQYLYYVGN
jgi:hypothetical protein